MPFTLASFHADGTAAVPKKKKQCDHIGRPAKAKAKARAIGQRIQGHWMQSDSKERRSLWSSVAVSVRFSFK